MQIVEAQSIIQEELQDVLLAFFSSALETYCSLSYGKGSVSREGDRTGKGTGQPGSLNPASSESHSPQNG